MHNFLDFERPIAELEAKIEELARMGDDVPVNISGELRRLQAKSRELTLQIFGNLSPWQITQLARHPLRPHTLDYVSRIFSDFDELHGDRHYIDDKAIVGGIAYLEQRPVMIIGHEKGRKTKEKVERNFGMPQPEGYRKALRLMQLAERFSLPVLTFIDTAGAYPGIAAEEHNQSEAIARNLYELAGLKTPVICTVIGEGGSGGALALGVGDYVMMLQYSIYSVISPEGCASILWKSAERAADAAEALKVNAENLLKQQLVDKVLPEPLGGAHRNIDEMAQHLKAELILQLDKITKKPIDVLLTERYERLMSYGQRVLE
ncbi:MAG: acetyl-CoA carboxylase carboxyltransferase subunit alpha [Gammaproteobacteria bacterium]|nr:acetyl-CoA carboxylase carboxyltransferase subunit alpha [Gammaproteobacteria bacterium]